MGGVCGSEKPVETNASPTVPKPAAAAAATQKPVEETKAATTTSDAPPVAAAAAVKVYGLGMSTCTRRVLTTLEEKGVPYELVVIDITKGEHKTPEFLEKQPFGQIPVFEHGDVRIFESRAISRYIAATWADQGTDLLGKDDAAKANTSAWLEAEHNNYNPPVSTLVYEKMFKKWTGAGEPDEAIVVEQLAKLDKVLDVYEGILSKQEYLAGANFTLADLSHLPYTAYAFASGVGAPFEARPGVKAWWDRISARDSWKKVLANTA